MDLNVSLFPLALGLPWWWLFAIGLFFVLDTVLVETSDTNNGAGIATLLLIVLAFSIAYFAYGISPLTALLWIFNNLQAVLVYTLMYLTVGVVWCTIRWYFYLTDLRKSEIHKTQLWASKRIEEGYNSVEVKPIRPYQSYASNNKTRLAGYLLHWPMSMVGFLIGDFIARIVGWVIDFFASVFERMANRVFKDFQDS